MQADFYREAANQAVRSWLQQHSSNAVTSSQVWMAVNTALDCYEDEITRAAELWPGWAITLGDKVVLVVDTKRQARQQRRYLRRRWPARYKIQPTQIQRD